MVPLLIKRYLWLVDTLRRVGDFGLTHREINEAWANPYNQLYKDCGNEEISRRTLLNHRNAIREQFKIEIECVRRGADSRYRINNDISETNPVVEWLLSAVATENLAAEYSSISDKILLEPADKGSIHLPTITQALKANQRLIIDYQGFHIGQQPQADVLIEPLSLKMFKRRWYLLANKVEADGYRLYALDRIRRCILTEVIYEYPKGFSAEEYFSDFYGVSTDAYTERPCRVVLRAYQELPAYLIVQPLHHSQEVVMKTDSYTDFSYWLRSAFDFIQEILSHGNQLEVIKPESLRELVGKILKISSEKYL
ncbi:MAG: WYL domain-containing protein [Paramuribaculum sp.]|nr:WYL domain-containing protein [Paramuribaculum sp.]